MDAPHLTVPESGSSSPMRILNSIVTASSFLPRMAILSSLPTMKLTLFKQLHAVNGLADLGDEQPVLARLAVCLKSDPGIASAGGGHLLDGELIEQLAAARCLTGLALVCRRSGEMKLCSSAIFCSAFLFWSLMSFCMSWLDSYQKS